eukprot:4109448-Prymnesium_polylepis.1
MQPFMQRALVEPTPLAQLAAEAHGQFADLMTKTVGRSLSDYEVAIEEERELKSRLCLQLKRTPTDAEVKGVLKSAVRPSHASSGPSGPWVWRERWTNNGIRLTYLVRVADMVAEDASQPVG